MKHIKLFEGYNSPNWRNKITIKQMFGNTNVDELDEKNEKGFSVRDISKYIVSRLKKIQEKEEARVDRQNGMPEDEFYHINDELEMVIDNFEFLAELEIDGDTDMSEYGFENDESFQDILNDYLSMLYDLGDTRVVLVNGNTEKFMWIG